MTVTAHSVPLRSSSPARPRVSHAQYRQEPYVRCRFEALAADGKAVAWTRTEVLVHWIDDDGQAHNRWVPAAAVVRIARDDSAWRDPYDDFDFYYPSLHASGAPAR
ncbi:hypothetical protein GCM10009636_04390 [Arthrobacter koreensis]|uniref:hypothetical protein n=1 Tax=Arthrobacter koreensis TaxID=199136 RepID=UPI0012642CFB|nr:hypothetical protein [Arthrobacter koreensis]